MNFNQNHLKKSAYSCLLPVPVVRQQGLGHWGPSGMVLAVLIFAFFLCFGPQRPPPPIITMHVHRCSTPLLKLLKHRGQDRRVTSLDQKPSAHFVVLNVCPFTCVVVYCGFFSVLNLQTCSALQPVTQNELITFLPTARSKGNVLEAACAKAL